MRSVAALSVMVMLVAGCGGREGEVGTRESAVTYVSGEIRNTRTIDIEAPRSQTAADVAYGGGVAVFVWTDPDDPWIGEVQRITSAVTGAPSPIAAAPYFTDASALTPAFGNPPTIILGPGEAAKAHQTDEYCSVQRIREASDIYARLAARWSESAN